MRTRGICRIFPAVLAAAVLMSTACVSYLREAKYHYSRGQELSRDYQSEKALAAYKQARLEADLAVKKNPSAQAFMVRGLAEMKLRDWRAAEESFLASYAYGFEKGEEWAHAVSVYGLSLSLIEMGLEDAAQRNLAYLTDQCRVEEVQLASAQKYTDIMLDQLRLLPEKERTKGLTALFKKMNALTVKNPGASLLHYLQSQICGHQKEYRRGFEEAVIAKELGLPSEKISRDNDLFIIFCVRKMKESLPSEEWERFNTFYSAWTEKWGWPDSLVPLWKR